MEDNRSYQVVKCIVQVVQDAISCSSILVAECVDVVFLVFLVCVFYTFNVCSYNGVLLLVNIGSNVELHCSILLLMLRSAVACP